MTAGESPAGRRLRPLRYVNPQTLSQMSCHAPMGATLQCYAPRRGLSEGVILHADTRRVPEDCPPAVRDILHQCLERDPAARPRAAEVAALLGGDAALLQQPLQPRGGPQPAAEVTFSASEPWRQPECPPSWSTWVSGSSCQVFIRARDQMCCVLECQPLSSVRMSLTACQFCVEQEESPELAVCVLHRALAAEVYGTDDNARAAGVASRNHTCCVRTHF